MKIIVLIESKKPNHLQLGFLMFNYILGLLFKRDSTVFFVLFHYKTERPLDERRIDALLFIEHTVESSRFFFFIISRFFRFFIHTKLCR